MTLNQRAAGSQADLRRPPFLEARREPDLQAREVPDEFPGDLSRSLPTNQGQPMQTRGPLDDIHQLLSVNGLHEIPEGGVFNGLDGGLEGGAARHEHDGHVQVPRSDRRCRSGRS
jgi:hypothetical protein